jgi:hypothetical protein
MVRTLLLKDQFDEVPMKTDDKLTLSEIRNIMGNRYGLTNVPCDAGNKVIRVEGQGIGERSFAFAIRLLI